MSAYKQRPQQPPKYRAIQIFFLMGLEVRGNLEIGNIGPMIRIGREIQCLPYAGFFCHGAESLTYRSSGNSLSRLQHGCPPKALASTRCRWTF